MLNIGGNGGMDVARLGVGEISSNDDALSFLFAVRIGSDGQDGEFRARRRRLHFLIEKALHQIIAQFEVELAIPWVKGRFGGDGATVIYLDTPDFRRHSKLYDPNSFGVLEVHSEALDDDGVIYTGFDAYVRLGESNTWLCICVNPADPVDFDDSEDGAYIDPDEQLGEPEFSKENREVLANIAARVSVADGFGSVALRVEPREQFAAKIAKQHMSDFIDLGPLISEEKIASYVAYMARDYWEFYVIPMRAKFLKEEGVSSAQIARRLGITKHRAERALELAMTLDDGINSPYLMPLIQKYESDTFKSKDVK